MTVMSFLSDFLSLLCAQRYSFQSCLRVRVCLGLGLKIHLLYRYILKYLGQVLSAKLIELKSNDQNIVR